MQIMDLIAYSILLELIIFDVILRRSNLVSVKNLKE